MTYVGQVRKPPAALFWGVFAVTVAAAWAALLDMSLGFAGPVRDLGPGMALFEPVQWLGQLCAAGAELQRLEMLWAMWALMVVAMMGPAAMPHLVAYSRMGSRGGRGPSALSLAALAGGYLAVWILYAVGAAGIQFILSTGSACRRWRHCSDFLAGDDFSRSGGGMAVDRLEEGLPRPLPGSLFLFPLPLAWRRSRCIPDGVAAGFDLRGLLLGTDAPYVGGGRDERAVDGWRDCADGGGKVSGPGRSSASRVGCGSCWRRSSRWTGRNGTVPRRLNYGFVEDSG